MARAAAAIVLALSLTLVWQAAGLFRRDLAFTAAETEVSFWGRGSYQPDEFTQARIGRTLEMLVTQAPGNPDYLFLAASYQEWRALWALDPRQREVFLQRAAAQWRAAREARPAHPFNEQTLTPEEE
jgi:hypothetical protein